MYAVRPVRGALPLFIRSAVVVAPPAPCALRPAPVYTLRSGDSPCTTCALRPAPEYMHRCVVNREPCDVGSRTGGNHVEPRLEKSRHVKRTPTSGRGGLATPAPW